jgi:D-alanine-D-alanine ligase-like ATP-grasp enzyme
MLIDLSTSAYLACYGTGYGRVDIRSNINDIHDPGFKLFVLEVNAQPGFSFDAENTSMGKILLLGNIQPKEFMETVLNYA